MRRALVVVLSAALLQGCASYCGTPDAMGDGAICGSYFVITGAYDQQTQKKVQGIAAVQKEKTAEARKLDQQQKTLTRLELSLKTTQQKLSDIARQLHLARQSKSVKAKEIRRLEADFEIENRRVRDLTQLRGKLEEVPATWKPNSLSAKTEDESMDHLLDQILSR